MAITLAFVEATAVFGAAYTTLVLWAHPLIADWTEAPGLLGQAAALSLSCLAAFYDNDLYDVRTVRSLARILVHAGAVRAMELDINSYWVTFNSYRKSGGREARKLLAGMTRPALRYLTPDDRDFFAVGTR